MDTKISETYLSLTWDTEHVGETLSRLFSSSENLAFTISLLPASKFWNIDIVDLETRSISTLIFSRLEMAMEYCGKEALLNSTIVLSDDDSLAVESI